MKGKDKFDFSILFELMSSMKRSFWSLERSEERFHKALNRAHNNHFAKLMPAARKREGKSSGSGMGSVADRALRRQKRDLKKTKELEKRDNSTFDPSHRKMTFSVDSTRLRNKETSKNWFKGYFED